MKKALLAPLYFLLYFIYTFSINTMQEKTAYNEMCIILMRRYFVLHGTIDGYNDPPKTWVTWRQFWTARGYYKKIVVK